MDLGRPRRRLDLLVGGVRLGEAQVVGDRGVEEVRLLGDDADRAGQRVEVEVADVDAVDGDPAAGRRRTAAAPDSRAWTCRTPVGPTTPRLPPAGTVKSMPSSVRLRLVVVAEPDVLEADLALDLVEPDRRPRAR